MPLDCYACRLIEGAEPLPGGRIYTTEHWVVEHCTGPLGVGTLIVKPFRHCVHIGDLTTAEAQELGPLIPEYPRRYGPLLKRTKYTFAFGLTRDGNLHMSISSSNQPGTD